MPNDQEFAVIIGRSGLNLRDAPALVGLSGFTDALNWRLDEEGAPIKRLGYDTYRDDVGPTSSLPAPPLELYPYAPSGVGPFLVAYCTNGHVYSSSGDGTWTSLVSGLSTSAVPAFSVVNDILYWSNGVDSVQSWDGSSQAAVAAAPKGTTLTTWRNRLWTNDVAHPHRVWWSAIGDATTWPSLNFVDIFGPHGDPVTALIASPNIGSTTTPDGADGVIVFTESSAHRIYDDTDNVNGVLVGGANTMLDTSNGCTNHRTLATINGVVYGVGRAGIYATSGHSQMILQSAKLGRFFQTDINPSSRDNMTAVAWNNSYLLAVTPSDNSYNSIVLELYTALPQDSDHQHPIMAHTIPSAAWANVPSPTLGNTLYFADASTGNTSYVRRYEQGGADTTGVNTPIAITASARTGASNFNVPEPKRIRRVQATGRGKIQIGVVSDFATGVGETQTFNLTLPDGAEWNDGSVWGSSSVWGDNSGLLSDLKWYTQRGRYFGLTVNEISTDVSEGRQVLGIAGQPSGAAAIYAATLAVTPLATDF